MASGNHRRSGFTLIEVVASLVLMTVLFVALTSLLRCFANQRKALDRLAENHPSTLQLAELVRTDLINARLMQTAPNRITLIGNLAKEPTTRMPTGQRAEVTYDIQRRAESSWLVRREVRLDVTSSSRSREELLWQGATGIELVPDDESMNGTPAASQDSVPGMSPMPLRMRFFVYQESNKPLLDLRVVHHWEDG